MRGGTRRAEDGLPATSNKMAIDYVIESRPEVDWKRSARWVVAKDEKNGGKAL